MVHTQAQTTLNRLRYFYAKEIEMYASKYEFATLTCPPHISPKTWLAIQGINPSRRRRSGKKAKRQVFKRKEA